MNAGGAALAAAASTAESWQALYPFSSRWLTVDGHRLHYVDEGPRDAPALLLLHGNPTWSFYWREVVRAFSDRYRVIALDHLGCGLSDKPQAWSYRLAGHIANTERLVEHLGLKRVTLGVHDWGGAIGVGLAARRPQTVSRFVLLNTAAFRSRAMPLRIAACRVPVLGALGVRGLNGFARAATWMATSHGLAPAVRAGLLAPYGSWRDRVGVLRFVQDIPMDPGHPSWSTLTQVEKSLPRFADHPVLIVWGERDWCFTPAFRRQWESIFPRAESHPIADAGHYVLEDARDAVLGHMARFLERTSA